MRFADKRKLWWGAGLTALGGASGLTDAMATLATYYVGEWLAIATTPEPVQVAFVTCIHGFVWALWAAPGIYFPRNTRQEASDAIRRDWSTVQNDR